MDGLRTIRERDATLAREQKRIVANGDTRWEVRNRTQLFHLNGTFIAEAGEAAQTIADAHNNDRDEWASASKYNFY